MRLLKLAAGAATLALMVSGQAQAATWLVSYQSTGGNPLAADLTLTASDVLNAVGGFDVTGIAGNVDGDAVTGLIANPHQPTYSYSNDGMFLFDNVVFTGAPNVSWYGLLFQGASGNEYNLFADNASTYELYRAQSGVGYLANSVGSVRAQLAPVDLQDGHGNPLSGGVPEPAAWTMMILGFGGVGAMLRRRRTPLPA
jgi:hypothetical protein